MTGSIACYKACNLLSRLVQNHFDVQVVATPSALQFVGNSTLEGLTGKPVISDMHAAGNVMDHIHLMRWADAIVVAPATANFINKAAQGVADDLVQTLFMAHDFNKPFLIAPAMNASMYTHPVTQKNLKALQDMGLRILEPNSGTLACGEVGQGKLIEPEEIFARLLEELKISQEKSTLSADLFESRAQPPKNGPKILITAGGTQEPLDNVRMISNSSSGKTGVTIATHLTELGFDVTLLQSVNSPLAAPEVKSKKFTSFSSLDDLLKETLQAGHYDWIVHAAAVSDYSLDFIEMDGQRVPAAHKLSSTAERMTIHLKQNPKLIEKLKSYSRNKDIKVIGFKLTSHANAEQRAEAVHKVFKSADYVVHNDTDNMDPDKNLHTFDFYSSTQRARHLSSVYDLIAVIAHTVQGEEL